MTELRKTTPLPYFFPKKKKKLEERLTNLGFRRHSEPMSSTSSLNVLAWNCRGICNDSTVEALKTLIRQNHPVLIFLTETKVSNPSYMENLRLRLGFRNCEAVYSVNIDGDPGGQSGGLALFWKDDWDVEFLSKSLNHIDVVVNPNHFSDRWRFTGFYGHPNTAEKFRTWDLLKDLTGRSSLPWLVAGDFNDILHNGEKDGGVWRRVGQMNLFNFALQVCELNDLGYHGVQYT